MTNSVIIFGTGELAEVAHFFLRHDTDHDVVAFTVDSQYVKADSFKGLPVVPFEGVEKRFAPREYAMFIAVGYSKLNAVRTERCREARSKGYRLISYVSTKATVWPGIEIGDNCFILENNTIQPFVRIGNNVTLWSGNHVGHHTVIADNCFVTSHVVISGGVHIGERCFIGVNATIRDHVVIGRECVIGAGSLIVKDTSEREVYSATPAQLSRVPSNRLRNI